MCKAKQGKALARANISKTKTLIYKIKLLVYAFKPALIFNNIIFLYFIFKAL